MWPQRPHRGHTDRPSSIRWECLGTCLFQKSCSHHLYWMYTGADIALAEHANLRSYISDCNGMGAWWTRPQTCCHISNSISRKAGGEALSGFIWQDKKAMMVMLLWCHLIGTSESFWFLMSVQFLPFLIPERTSADINANNLDVFGGNFMTTVELVHSPYIEGEVN